jgi:hypothetical protein
MKLETKPRYDLTAVLAGMSLEKVNSVLDGIEEIVYWFGVDYNGVPGTGKLLISAKKDVTLVATTMAWLSKYFWPETVRGISTVYRLHDFSHVKGKPSKGRSVTITPFKPILSWSTKETPTVKDRPGKSADVVMSLTKPKVIFTADTLKALTKYFKSAPKDPRVDLHRYRYINAQLGDALRKFYSEHEAVVWHGTAPFKAIIEKGPG